ncbi:MAG TPA: tetratricopeptide repeat protein [Methanocella sp.]|jgi:tetratricopeptide (TPR) repeat protein
MLSRRLLALLLDMDDAGDILSDLTDDRLYSAVRRSLTAGFGDLQDDDGLSVLLRALDEYLSPGQGDRDKERSTLCHALYDRLHSQAQASGISYREFEAAFGRFLVALHDSLAQAREPRLTDSPCREFGRLSLDELSRMQAPEALSSYMSGLVTYFRDQAVIPAFAADYLIGLVEKMVSAPGYLRFLGEDKKHLEIARLLNLSSVVRSSNAPPGPVVDDMLVTIGLLLYNIRPSETVASSLAALRPSARCPALQYHYDAVLALSFVLTGNLDQASEHAEMAMGNAFDDGMTAYMLILQGCIVLGQGDYDRALELLKNAGSRAPDGRIKALAHFYRGIVFAEKKEYAEAIDSFREAGAHVTDPLDQATIYNNLGSCAFYHGDLPLAERSFAEMEKLANRLKGDSALQCRLVAGSISGAILREKGEYGRAIERLQATLKLALRSGDGTAVANVMGNLGAAYALTGDVATALQFLNTCMALSERMSYWPGIQFAYWHIGRLLTGKGNPSEARKFIDTYSARYPELRNLRQA